MSPEEQKIKDKQNQLTNLQLDKELRGDKPVVNVADPKDIQTYNFITDPGAAPVGPAAFTGSAPDINSFGSYQQDEYGNPQFSGDMAGYQSAVAAYNNNLNSYNAATQAYQAQNTDYLKKKAGYDTYNTNLQMLNTQYDPTTNQAAANAALRNVRGVGSMYGQYGLAGSGAGLAAAAQGAASPYAELSAKKAQAMTDLYNQYSGIVMPTYTPN